MRFHSLSLPIQLGSDLKAPQAGSWGTGQTGAQSFSVGGAASDTPMGQLDRIAFHHQHAMGGSVVTNAEGSVRYATPNRLLSPEQLHLIWQRTPDVRSGFDQIVRTVATKSWRVEPTIAMDDPAYEACLEVCEAASAFLRQPNMNDWTWQEVATAWMYDLLIHDNGPVELCRSSDGVLEEIVPVNGGEIHEIVDEHGRLIKYVQIPPTNAVADAEALRVDIDPDDMLLLQLFRTTYGPGGTPLLESLVYEVVAILRGAEYMSVNLDRNEIPPGLMVVTGLANDALDRFRAQYEGQSNQDWRMRFLAGHAVGPVDARWVELKRAPRELQVAELLKEIRRAIWRVIGVKPVMQGETEHTPRASAEVQMDASQSTLIGPICELLASKVNSRILPNLIPEEYVGLVAFAFVEEREMSETDKATRAGRLSTLVNAGILTIDEARAEIEYDPMDEEEDDDGAVSEPPEPEGDDDPDDVPEPNSPDDDDDDRQKGRWSAHRHHAGCGHSHRRRKVSRGPAWARQARAKARRKVATLVARFGPRHAIRQLHSRKVERVALMSRSIEEELPSEWQPGNRFEGARTISLPDLGDQIAGYVRDVAPLWEEARADALTAVASVYKAEGFDSGDEAELVSRLGQIYEKLLTDWSVASSGRYRAVAVTARNAAGDWTTEVDSEAAVERIADAYRERAIGYLLQKDGPVGTVDTRTVEMLSQVLDSRSNRRDLRQRAGLKPNATLPEVLARVAQIWDGQKHRIKNWSGRLVELAYQVVHDQLAGDLVQEGVGTGRPNLAQRAGKSQEWWVEWVAVHDKGTCDTCQREGMEPMRPLSSLPTVPGGATECRARCRCVLVYWTREEVLGGKAERYGKSRPVNPDDVPPAGPSSTPEAAAAGPNDVVRAPKGSFEKTKDGKLVLKAEPDPSGNGRWWYRMVPDEDDADVFLSPPVDDLIPRDRLVVNGHQLEAKIEVLDDGKTVMRLLNPAATGDDALVAEIRISSKQAWQKRADGAFVSSERGTLEIGEFSISPAWRGLTDSVERIAAQAVQDLSARFGAEQVVVKFAIREDTATLALMGFDFHTEELLQKARKGFAQYLRAQVGVADDLADEIVAQLNHAWDFAGLQINGTTVGRDWLIKQANGGILDVMSGKWQPRLLKGTRAQTAPWPAKPTLGDEVLQAFVDGSTAARPRGIQALLNNELTEEQIDDAFTSILRKLEKSGGDPNDTKLNWADFSEAEQRVWRAMQAYTNGPNAVVRDMNLWAPGGEAFFSGNFADIGALKTTTRFVDMLDAHAISTRIAARDWGVNFANENRLRRIAELHAQFKKGETGGRLRFLMQNDDAIDFFEGDEAILNVFRGGRWQADDLSILKAGDTLDTGVIGSWSTDLDIATGFATEVPMHRAADLERVIFAIRNPHRGQFIHQYSTWDDELEYLAGGKTRVVKVMKATDRNGEVFHFVLLEMI